MPIVEKRCIRRTSLSFGRDVLTTANAMPTDKAPQAELTDPEQATQQVPQDQESVLDSQVTLSQPDSSTKRAASGRMPLFRR
jgi:hypothetical protein